MASRERKRTERRKRKERSASRPERKAEQTTRQEAIAARTEAKNQAVRETLDPLEPGQRPLVVTIGAVLSALIALSSIIGYVAGVEVAQFGSDGIQQGEGEAPITSIIAVVLLMGVITYGMWNARYWAVLGFQALLALVLVAASLGLVQATDWKLAVGTTALIAGAGTMFYFMVKAMARIQMPERRSAK